MLSSVRYLHNKGIIHRDLKVCPLILYTKEQAQNFCSHLSLSPCISPQIKLENFLFRDKDADSELVMIDFGLSKHFTFGEVHSEAVGTPYTVAPEVIRGRYDERCDVWAIGE